MWGNFTYKSWGMKSNIKILIVEDEAITAMYLQFQLKKLNYNALKPVGSGESAIKVALKENPQFILMDIGLAGKMDGIQTAREIHSFCKPHIIFMTGYHDDELRVQAKSIISSSYLTKPIGIPDIVNIITNIELN
jgi:DNA-binding response OmpR family regulator